jgi:ribulose-5-phosphate 4-epimerase/fuculose-1-phosphate aldolase
MTEENALREQFCLLAKSVFDRRMTGGSKGKSLARTPDWGFLVSPTSSNFGMLEPARPGLFADFGTRVDGDLATNEMPVHPFHAVALSMPTRGLSDRAVARSVKKSNVEWDQ